MQSPLKIPKCCQNHLKDRQTWKAGPLHIRKGIVEAIQVKSEVSLMKAAALNNEGVVQYRHHFGDGSATYIIMEFCPLGVSH